MKGSIPFSKHQQETYEEFAFETEIENEVIATSLNVTLR